MFAALLPVLRNVAARARNASARAALVSFAAVTLAASTGCAPIVSLHHTEMRGASAGGVGVVAVLEVENENSFDVEIRHVHANVTIEGRHRLPPVDLQPNKWIRAGGKVRISVPLTVPWTTVPGLLAATAGSSEVTYRVRGTADITAGRSMRVRQQRYPVDQEGVIPRHALGKGGGPGGLPLPF